MRINGTKLGKPTKNNAPYLFNSKGRWKPALKDIQEIVEILNLGNADMDNRLI